MKLSQSLLLFLSVSLLLMITVKSSNIITKESWHRTPLQWERLHRVHSEQPVLLHFFIKQQNTVALEEKFWQVSDPRHPEYAKYLTLEQVNRLVAPSPHGIMRVAIWLESNGINLREQVKTTSNSDIMAVETTYGVAERLLHTEYYHFQHIASGRKIVRAHQSYGLPQEVANEIDFVGPTIRFPIVRDRAQASAPQDGVTPSFLRNLYSTNGASCGNNGNLQGVASFLDQWMDQEDLQSFFQQYDPQSAGRVPKIIGPDTSSEPGVEAMLDIEYIMAMAPNCTTQFWSTPGTQPHNPENEPFLVWLFNVSNTTHAPWVFSISYGDNEDTVDYDYAVRVNTEFQKAGVRGISLMASSGDGGVSGSQPSECTRFIPTFPAASPYITAVGGTTSSTPEVAADLSGGGFSNRWGRPSYQEPFVQQYFKVAQNLPPSNVYNHSGAGFPDVSAQAEGFAIVVSGFSEPVDGTSCSSPTFSGVVTLLNEVRLAAGKAPLGFLNPLFYQNPEAFNDVTSGSNPGCNTNGFQAAQGWDPVTGLGTPDYVKLAKVVRSLP